jgi:ABC-type lipoprotein release transport system permease subunit
VILGAMLGLAFVPVVVRGLRAALFGLAGLHLGLVVVAVGVILGAAWLACQPAARRASRVDPVVVLRSE